MDMEGDGNQTTIYRAHRKSESDSYRDGKLIQPYSASPVYIAFGMVPVRKLRKTPKDKYYAPEYYAVDRGGRIYAARDRRPANVPLNSIQPVNGFVSAGRTGRLLPSTENDLLEDYLKKKLEEEDPKFGKLDESEKKARLDEAKKDAKKETYDTLLNFLEFDDVHEEQRKIMDPDEIYEELVLHYLRDNYLMPEENKLRLSWFNDPAVSRNQGRLYFLETDGQDLFLEDTSTFGVSVEYMDGGSKMVKRLFDELYRGIEIDSEKDDKIIGTEDFERNYRPHVLEKLRKGEPLEIKTIVNPTSYSGTFDPVARPFTRIRHVPILINLEQDVPRAVKIDLGNVNDGQYKDFMIVSNRPWPHKK